MKNSAKIHDRVLQFLLNLKPVETKVRKRHIESFFDADSINYETNEIVIEYYDKAITNWYDGTIHKFYGRTCLTSEELIKGMKLSGEWVDAYGSILTKNGLLLNNYDATFDEDCWNKHGFCDIYSFATISENGIIRFSRVIYSFKNKSIGLYEDITHELSFIPDLKKDFRGKRATYRYDNILSIRTTEEVYEKIDDDFKQPYSSMQDLSYPRYQIKF